MKADAEFIPATTDFGSLKTDIDAKVEFVKVYFS